MISEISSNAGDTAPQGWYHTIDLADGTSTPGIFDMREVARRVPWPARLSGGRCLDVGTCDGFWAFEMERHGAASVTALDVASHGDLDLPWEVRQRDAKVPPLREGTNAARRFELARQLLDSRVERLSCTVYDLDPAVHGRFDVVLCGTLLVHLRDPIRALERIRDVCTGELVLVECVDAILDLSAFRRPAARFAPSQAQWWRANTAGLHSALRVAGFEVLSTSRRFVTPFGAGITAGQTGLRRLLAGARSTLVRWPMLTRMPGLVEALGLWRGSFDIVIRARPRSIA